MSFDPSADSFDPADHDAEDGHESRPNPSDPSGNDGWANDPSLDALDPDDPDLEASDDEDEDPEGPNHKDFKAWLRPDVRAGRVPTASRLQRQRGIREWARNEGRCSRETLVERARYLSEKQRALILAHYAAGIEIPALAQLHNITHRLMWWQIRKLRERLAKPIFLLASQYARDLPPPYCDLARAHWVEGIDLRTLAKQRQVTLHRIRAELTLARSLLVVAAGNRHTIDTESAARALDQRRRLRPKDSTDS